MEQNQVSRSRFNDVNSNFHRNFRVNVRQVIKLLKDDFETQNFDFWHSQVQTNGTLSITDADKINGNYHLRCSLTAVASQKRVSVGKDFAAVTSKYAQGLFRYSNDVGTNRLTFIGLYPSETGAYLIAAYVQNGKLMIQYRHNAANPVFDTQQAFPVNTLKRLEVK